MQRCIPSISPVGYGSSPLHAAGRDWPETNCYTDVWIEVLHARGGDPAAGLGFTVAQDFEGDHFTFFKYSPEDLESLYGVRVSELAIYDTVERQVAEQIARGRLPLVEVDSFYLPDTQGAGYRQDHGKTTIAINAIDPVSRRMQYFHNTGFHEIRDGDYNGSLGMVPTQVESYMPFPYVEFAKFDRPGDTAVSVEAAVTLLRRHLKRRPDSNPVAAFQQRLAAQAADVSQREPAFFHKYAFNTFRQVGANFELLASHLDWLMERGEHGLELARASCVRLSAEAKIMQFQLARAVARRRTDALEARMAPLVDAYDLVLGELVRLYPQHS